nr:reverse transcriptase domain-containing protein [Tanacetum cinerariifolium]
MTSSSKLSRDQTSNPTSSTNPTPKGRIRRSSKQKVENSNFEEHLPTVATMTDNRIMAEMLRAPTEGCAEAIVVPPILAEQFELQHSLINMMTSEQFFGLEKDNPHDHIRWFNKITSTIKYKDVPNSCLAAGGNTFPEFRDNIQGYASAAAGNYNQGNPGYRPQGVANQMRPPGSGSLLGNTVANPKGELKAITTRSGLVTDGPTVPTPLKSVTPKEDECVEETYTEPDLVEYTIKVPPPPVQKQKPPVQRNFVLHTRDSLLSNISYPSRMLKQKQQEKYDIQIQKFWHMFKQLHLNITLAEALVLMPKYQKMLKALLSNKEKIQELANTHLNENCSVVILKKLPEKLRDPGEFLIPCGFSKDSDLKDSIDQTNLVNLDDYFVDPIPEMFTDEHAPDYSFPLRFDVYPDDFLEIKSDADNFYNDPFDSKGETIKESELLIDKLDLPCDFLPYSEYDSFASQDFSRDDDLPSPDNEDK